MKPVHERRWNIRHPDPAQVEQLVRETGMNPLVAGILVNRGMADPEKAGVFLSSALSDLRDPFLLKGMEAAVSRLALAAARNEKVCVYGDYDVDGITSVALLISFFREAGIDCFYYIPRRLEDGYGLAADGIETVARRGARVIVTVDCGITAMDEAILCSSLGIDLIITDHHTPGAELPKALAVINPMQPGCPFPFKYLAGVGVAFNLLIALRSRLREQGHFGGGGPNLRQYLDLVALGTIADIVPLVDENRIFAKYGLTELTIPGRTGVEALKNVAGVRGAVNCGAVGFRLAPRLNAAGRLEDAALGVELLLCGDGSRAAAIAGELDTSNTERQALEQEILRDALSMVKRDVSLSGKKSIVLASETWHPGVIGIVASRIVDMFHRPTVLIALQDGNGRGSGRSIPNFHLHDALHACSEHLVKFGGHKYAAGLTIAESTLEAFVEMFDEVAAGCLSEDDLTPELSIDAELSPAEVSLELANIVESLAPFGMGNPEPVFAMQGLRVTDQQILKESHVKLRLAASNRNFEAIGFNMADSWGGPKLVDIAFTLQKNSWNGRETLQLKLKDVKAGTRNKE